MKIPLFDLTRQYKKIREEIIENIDDVISSGQVILGKNVNKLEQEIKEFLNANYTIGVANGSDALLIATKALGIKEGDYVITTPYTFFATASCITRNGATPIFVDVEDKYYNIDLDEVEKVLETHPQKEKIKAVIPVHLFGKTLNMDKLKEIKEKYGVYIIEDAAQSIGSVWIDKNGEEKKSGTFFEYGTTSFFPTKNLGGYGDGGMIFAQTEDLYNKAKKLRVHGASKKYHHDEIGFNSRLDEIQAAILNVKTKYLEDYISRRMNIAKNYEKYFKKSGLDKFIEYPEYFNNKTHVYHQYVITLKSGNRDEFQKYLKDNGIGTAIYYPVGLHSQKCFEYLGYKENDFPVTYKATKNTLALPIFPELKIEEQEYVVKKIEEYFKR